MSIPGKVYPSPAFTGLDDRIVRWLDYEQLFNERLFNRQFSPPTNCVKESLRPESRSIWNQEVVWLPKKFARCYGRVEAELRAAFGFGSFDACVPLFLHAQPTVGHRRLKAEYGSEWLGSIAATPTSSCRSVETWSRDGTRSPVVLKLSLGALSGQVRRAYREKSIARAVVISSLLEKISLSDRERLRLDWFSEPAGAVETVTRHGWLLRRLPTCLRSDGTSTLVPVCSLISRRGKRPPLLVDLIGNSRPNAEEFVVDRLFRPYVRALAHLLFEEGVGCDAHSQNVLVEIGRRERLTGRLVLRDFSDSTINLALRLAKGKPLPLFPRGFLPARPPFPVTANAADFRNNLRRSTLRRGYDTVERFGLWGCVWPINASLKRFFKGYDTHLVEQRYLDLWQQATIRHLGLRPLFRKRPKGIATDEAIAYFLSQIDWRNLGAVPSRLHQAAEPLLIGGRVRRLPGRVYLCLGAAWGDFFIHNGLPAFFRPAF